MAAQPEPNFCDVPKGDPLSCLPLSRLIPGQKAVILEVKKSTDASLDDVNWRIRLAEMGLVEGETVTIRHFGPLGRDPIAVAVRGGLVAIGRREAEQIEVEVLPS